MKVEVIPIELIIHGGQQARSSFNQASLIELADSINESGIIQPLVVRRRREGYELLAGERRWRAAQLAGLEGVPAIIRDDVGNREASVLGLVENLQREALSPVETARGLERLITEHGLTHAQAGERIGKSRVYVTNYLRLLNLAEPVRNLIDQQQLSLGHAKVLAAAPVGIQKKLARQAIHNRWSVRTLEKYCAGTDRVVDKASLTKSATLDRMENALSDQLGNRVQIHYTSDKGSGELRIIFHSLDEFDGLLDRLGVCRHIGESSC